MTEDIQLTTDSIDEETLIEYASQHDTCNGFAFWYLENVNGNALVKDSEFYGRDHCYVYDPDIDATIDATCAQFQDVDNAPDAWDDMPWAGAWSGDEHPYGHQRDEIFVWESREDFEEHWGQYMNGPYIL